MAIDLKALLLGFSPVAVAVLIITAVPPFIAGVKFAGDAFQLARRRNANAGRCPKKWVASSVITHGNGTSQFLIGKSSINGKSTIQ